MTLKRFDQSLIDLNHNKDLTFAAAREVFVAMFKQELPEAFTKAFLLLLAKKGESLNEISACVSALESLEQKIPTKLSGLIDTCGTGGDHSGSVNVSTLAAMVTAGAGGKVAKHGNRGISSKCGSSDLLEALGVNLAAGPSKMLTSLEKYGLGYFHAPYYHPVFGKMQLLRKALGVRTIFNYLGPLVNPLKLSFQLVGVSNKASIPVYAGILRKQKIKRAWVCHGENGMDELTLGTNLVTEVTPSKFRSIQFKGISAVGQKSNNTTYASGSLKANLKFAKLFLSGKAEGRIQDTILINAAASLYLCGIASSVKQGYKIAKESVAKKLALRALEGLIKISNG